MDRIMLTSIILLGQNVNVNDVDIMVFEPSVLSPPPPQFGRGVGGEIDDMVYIDDIPQYCTTKKPSSLGER